jgi:hypothetical protein
MYKFEVLFNLVLISDEARGLDKITEKPELNNSMTVLQAQSE